MFPMTPQKPTTPSDPAAALRRAIRPLLLAGTAVIGEARLRREVRAPLPLSTSEPLCGCEPQLRDELTPTDCAAGGSHLP